MGERRVEIFFYGLFMDRELLESVGIQPVDIRVAAVRGMALRIGTRAGLVPTPGQDVHGVLMKLTHAEIEKLYSDPSVRMYRPEPVLAVLKDGSAVPALSYNLPEAPNAADHNAEYGAKLRALATRVGLPASYAASIQ